jgi:hypothetical protein
MPIAKRCSRFLFLGCLLVLPSAAVFAQASDTRNTQPNGASCLDCIRIRVGLPRVVRGSDGTAVDNTLSEIKLPNGRFRGFTAVGTSWAIDGNTPSDDETRVKLFQTEREVFKTFVRQGRVAAIIYYNWTALPGFESRAIVRCGELTDAGKLARSPM